MPSMILNAAIKPNEWGEKISFFNESIILISLELRSAS